MITDIFMMILNQINTLIAGVTGSGKSVLLNGIIYNLIKSGKKYSLYLIDPKRIGLKKFACLPNCEGYADDTGTSLDMLEEIRAIMLARYDELDEWQEMSEEPPIYVIIDELTDLTLQGGKRFKDLLQSLNQLCRAANIHIIAAAQSPSRKSLPAEIALNFTCRVGLHCADATMSKQITGFKGAENLPEHGKALVSIGGNVPKKYDIPYIDTDKIKSAVLSACNQPKPLPPLRRVEIRETTEHTNYIKSRVKPDSHVQTANRQADPATPEPNLLVLIIMLVIGILSGIYDLLRAFEDTVHVSVKVITFAPIQALELTALAMMVLLKLVSYIINQIDSAPTICLAAFPILCILYVL